MQEETLAILKPDVIKRNIIGSVITYIEKAGLKIIASKMLHLTQEQAEKFYEIHKERSFFSELVKFMTSGPVIVQVLEGDGALLKYRNLMGDTNPERASKGTIRADFAQNIDANCTHGSDSIENAKKEIAFFFSPKEIFERH